MIDLALATGGSFRGVAAQHGLSASAVRNHGRLHLARTLACTAPDLAAAELQAVVETRQSIELAINATIRDHVTYDVARIEKLIGEAMAKGQHGVVAMLMRTKWLILGRSGIAVETEKPLNVSPEDVTDPRELRAQSFEKVIDAVNEAMLKALSTPTVDEELPDDPPAETVRHRTRRVH